MMGHGPKIWREEALRSEKHSVSEQAPPSTFKERLIEKQARRPAPWSRVIVVCSSLLSDFSVLNSDNLFL